MQKPSSIEAASKLVAETYYGDDGAWLYRTFEAINHNFFFGELPWPLITIEITPHSRCLAWCSNSDNRPPRIAIHPTLFGVRETPAPWGISPLWLGRQYVFDTLLHECIHASVHYRLGGYTGPTSHNNDEWISEVNRIAPLIGFKGIEAGRQVAKRVPIKGELTKRGKPKTKVAKVDLGNIPFSAAAMFPHALRDLKRKASKFYRGGRFPVSIAPK